MSDALTPPAVPGLLGPDGVVRRVRPAAYAWCEQDGCVLLSRIAPPSHGAGKWTLPGGGLRFGEKPEAAAVREVREETGLDVVLGDLLGVLSTVLEASETVSGHRLHMIGILYRATVTGGELRDEVGGSSDMARWVPFAELGSTPLTPHALWAVGLVRTR